MNKLRYFATLLVGAFLVNACSNDFELTSDWKEIPVVFAILNPSDAYHYVRIEKAFLDPKRNALEVAQIADSLYYPEEAISVFIRQKSTTTLYPLSRVDGNLVGIKRDSGIFAGTPNWLYRISSNDLPGGLREQFEYELIIKRMNGLPDITATTIIPKSFQIVSPNPTNTPPVISFVGKAPTTFRWTHDNNAVFFNVTLTIPYREIDANTGAIIRRDTIVWRPVNNLPAVDGGNSIALVPGYDFYEMLDDEITTPRDGRVRVFGTTVGITVEGGGREIREYLLTAEANSGLTGAEIVQTYTNLSEGFGVFSAKSIKTLSTYRFSEITLDSIRAYSKTRELNFKVQ
jgi:hypothetical protein